MALEKQDPLLVHRAWNNINSGDTINTVGAVKNQSQLSVLISNVKMLLRSPFRVPKEIDTPGMIAYHSHYWVGVMLTFAAYPIAVIILTSFIDMKWLVLLMSIIFSFLIVLFVGWAKEKVDDMSDVKYFDPLDVNFTVSGWVVMSILMIPITALVIFLG